MHDANYADIVVDIGTAGCKSDGVFSHSDLD